MNKINNNKNNFTLVANDAGAAAHILAWFESGLLDINKYKFCLEGPAAKLFNKQFTNLKILPQSRIF